MLTLVTRQKGKKERGKKEAYSSMAWACSCDTHAAYCCDK
jgi:hypothetical protein